MAHPIYFTRNVIPYTKKGLKSGSGTIHAYYIEFARKQAIMSNLILDYNPTFGSLKSDCNYSIHTNVRNRGKAYESV